MHRLEKNVISEFSRYTLFKHIFYSFLFIRVFPNLGNEFVFPQFGVTVVVAGQVCYKKLSTKYY